MNATRRKELDEVITLIERANEIMFEAYDLLESIREEEEEAYENLPDSLKESERGEAMYEALSNLEYAIDCDWNGALTDMCDYIEEAKN